MKGLEALSGTTYRPSESLFPFLSALRKNIGGNFLWANCSPIYLKVSLVAKERPPHLVGHVNLNLNCCSIVIPFAYVRNSRKKHGD
jgi:hypothetical protein